MSYAYYLKNNLYLNITNRCTNDCIFCFLNYSTDSKKDYKDWFLKKEPNLDEALSAVFKKYNKNIKEIVYCGLGEPLLRLDEIILPTLKVFSQKYDNKLRLNTNGHAKLLYSNRNIANELKGAGLDAITISLNAENVQKYEKLCRPKLGSRTYGHLIDFIKDCKEAKLDVEITALTIPRELLPKEIKSPNISLCKDLSSELGVNFRQRFYKGPQIKENKSFI